MNMQSIIEKVLGELDTLGDKGIQSQILGMGGDMAARAGGEGVEKPEASIEVEAEGELSPEMLEKLKALLAE